MLRKILGLHKCFIWLMIGITLVLCSFRWFEYWNSVSEYPNNKPTVFSEQIKRNERALNEFVYIDIIEKPILAGIVKRKSIEYKYYFVRDTENVYIIRIKESTVEEICKAFDEQKENFSFRLKGFTYYVPQMLRMQVVDMVNEGRIRLKNPNFDDASLGLLSATIYLDEVNGEYATIKLIIIFLMIFSVIFTIVVFIKIVVVSFVTKKTFKEMDRYLIMKELSEINLKQFAKEKIYLTESYVIFEKWGLRVFTYSDIEWVYITNKKKKRRSKKSALAIHLNNDKVYYTKYVKKKYKKDFEQIICQIYEKRSALHVGYDYENMQSKNNTHVREFIPEEGTGRKTIIRELKIRGALLSLCGAAFLGVLIYCIWYLREDLKNPGIGELFVLSVFIVFIIGGLILIIFGLDYMRGEKSCFVKGRPYYLQLADDLIENTVYEDKNVIISEEAIAAKKYRINIVSVYDVLAVYETAKKSGHIEEPVVRLELINGTTLDISMFNQPKFVREKLILTIVHYCPNANAGYSSKG